MAEIRVGQIWREVDPRKERYVRVLDVRGGWVQISTVEKSGNVWTRVRGTTKRHAAVDRFNGKRGGYALHEAPVAGNTATQMIVDDPDAPDA